MTNFLHPPRQEGDPTPPPPDCEVGYGRPPIHTQFRKGDGRKRPGRPKGSRNLKTELIRIYTEPVVIKIGGKRRRMPAIIALLTLQFQRALTSDSRAAEAVFKKTKELGLFAPNEHCGSVELQTNETTSLPDPDFVARVYQLQSPEALARLSDDELHAFLDQLGQLCDQIEGDEENLPLS